MSERPSLLAGLTAGWRARFADAGSDLDEAWRLLAGMLSRGLPPGDLDLGSAARITQPDGTAPMSVTPQGSTLAFVRNALGTGIANPLATPTWATGIAQAATLGPFINPLGIANIVVTLPLTRSRTITFGTAAQGFAVLPVSSGTGGSLSLRGKRVARGEAFHIGCGRLLRLPHRRRHARCERTAYATGRGRRGSSRRDAHAHRHARAGSRNAGYGPRIGDDRHAGIGDDQPISFTQNAAAITALSGVSVTLYGTGIDVSSSSFPVAPVPGLPVLAAQDTPDISSFAFAALQSADLLGEASGAGSILLALGSGATLAADAHGIANVSNLLVAIDPQTLFVLATGSGVAVSTIYTLWPMEAPASWAAAAAVPAEGVGSPTVSAGA